MSSIDYDILQWSLMTIAFFLRGRTLVLLYLKCVCDSWYIGIAIPENSWTDVVPLLVRS